MKKFIMLLLVAVLLLAGCKNNVKVEETATDEAKTGESSTVEEAATQKADEVKALDEKTKTVLSNSAKQLTKAIALSMKGFSADPANPSTKLAPPSGSDSHAVTTFLIMMMSHSNTEKYPEANHTIYSKSIYMDKNSVYHLKKSFIPVLLNDVLGVSDFEGTLNVFTQQLNFKYDKKTDEYSSGLEFGSGYEWSCKEITGVKLDENKKEITVDYKAENDMSFAAGAKKEIVKYSCKNVYSYESKSDGGYSLKFKSAEAVDYVTATQ